MCSLPEAKKKSQKREAKSRKLQFPPLPWAGEPTDGKMSVAKANKEAKEMKESRGGGPRSKNVKDGKKSDSSSSVLKTAFKVNFCNAEEASEWDAKCKGKLTKSGNHILHRLAEREGDAEKWTAKQVKEFLDWVLGRYHHLLKERVGSENRNSLHSAIEKGNVDFVKAIVENRELINLGDVLSQVCATGNALHVAIRSQNRSIELIELLVEKCAELSLDKMFTAGGAADGVRAKDNTPLHDCMSMDTKKVDEEDEDDDDDDDDDGDDSDEGEEGDKELDDGGDAQDPNGGWTDLKSPNAVAKHEFGPLIRAPTIKQGTPKERNDTLQLVKLLIEKHTPALMATNIDETANERRTPYQERIHQLRLLHSDKDEDGKAEMIAQDEVANYIREYCIRNLPRDQIMKCLYQRGQGKLASLQRN